MKNSNYKLNIDGEAFSSMREDFNKILKRTVNNMESKGSNNAEITIKLKIELVPDFLPPTSSDDEGRAILKPKFEHKVSSVMNTKFEESGSLKGDYELVWDEDAQDYIARPVGSYQVSIFDCDTESDDYYEVNAEENCKTEPLMLEEAKVEEETDAEVLEGDFDDIDAVVENLKEMYEVEE